MHPDSPAQFANSDRWSADDDAWRGYKHGPNGLVLEDRIKQTLALVLPKPNGALLDVGCATGVVTRLMAERAGIGRFLGVDFVKAPNAQIEVHPVNLDANESLPFPDASFDLVTCLETIEHVHDTDHLIDELHRVLKPDGYAVLSVPRIDGLLTVAMLALGMQPPAIECSLRRRYGAPDAGTRVSGHVSHFTRRAFAELLEAHGFRVDAFAQASIYSSWLLATPHPRLSTRLPLWVLSRIPFKQDVQIVRVLPRPR